jgi:hypothetical protein
MIQSKSTHVSNVENFSYLFHRVQKTAKNAVSPVFSLGDLTFSITAQNRFELGEIWNRLIIFIWYNIDFCGASSSPDHRVESLAIFTESPFYKISVI